MHGKADGFMKNSVIFDVGGVFEEFELWGRFHLRLVGYVDAQVFSVVSRCSFRC